MKDLRSLKETQGWCWVNLADSSTQKMHEFKGKIWNLNSAQWRAVQTPAGSHLLPSCNTEYTLQQKDRQKFKFQTDLEFSEFFKV